MDLSKRFSIAHHDRCLAPAQFYAAIQNSSSQFKNEIFDIYFGKVFRYNYEEQEIYDRTVKSHEVVYGNVMGVEASDEQVKYLFKIQAELGIPVSLTINQLNIPVEVFYSKNNRVVEAFIGWLQDFYDRGLRSCTLANNHLMRTGFLQAKFPEMIWKNTVNQQVATAQQVLDYLYLGYNVIQLDRSLNRNIDELKRIKEVVDSYKDKYAGKYVKTSLLVREDCMPYCLFKREHDDMIPYRNYFDYDESHLWKLSCSRWKETLGVKVPRFGTSCFWISVESFEEYAGLVDVFKYSGRLNDKVHPREYYGETQFGWTTGEHMVDSFSRIIENRLESIYSWTLADGNFSRLERDIDFIRKDLLKDDLWMSDAARRLEQKLKNCRNQCYGCHLCEKTFGLSNFDSLVEL